MPWRPRRARSWSPRDAQDYAAVVTVPDTQEEVAVSHGSCEDEYIRHVQIDTSVQLSQNTVSLLFGSSSESETELSQAAVSRAFDISPSDLQAFNVDVNFVPDEENISDFESFSSSGSDGSGIREHGSDSDRGGIEQNDDFLSDSDAVTMDAAFMTSLQIGKGALGRTATKQRIDALRSIQWSQVSKLYEADTPAHPGLVMEEAKPVSELVDVCHSPILMFSNFVPNSLWVMINAETNGYSLQQVQTRAQVIHAKQRDPRRETINQIVRRLKAKPAYDTHEILQFIRLLAARMLCPQKRRFASDWSTMEDGTVPAGVFGRFMGRYRCQDIMEDLHFVDNTAGRSRDKLWKLRPVIDKLQHRF
ncbi:unnamed protein product [Phytophthora fragariaefolia]|uniref:Unnamed protein product n=1 Tax=Phytophthora fragariaefolia TaxID=1490495 RepID=A0A9W6U704_9STRA|nr:unnamed protein product [Phytophthora fragariaefolia]